MPQINIVNLDNKRITFRDKDKTLTILHQNFIDWMHQCGGKGRCTTCKMIVISGMEMLSPPSPFEEKCRTTGLLKNDERLACQCSVSGDIVINVPKENKLPHIKYSD